MVVHKGTTDLDGLIDGTELASAITGNDDGVRIIVLAGCLGSQCTANSEECQDD